MDLPLELNTGTVVHGMDEIKQCMVVLLKEERGTLLSDYRKGSYFSVHSTDVDLLGEAIERTIEQIPGIQISNLTVSDENIKFSFSYMNAIDEFIFNVN